MHAKAKFRRTGAKLDKAADGKATTRQQDDRRQRPFFLQSAVVPGVSAGERRGACRKVGLGLPVDHMIAIANQWKCTQPQFLQFPIGTGAG